ncbi:unnamed protein product [Cyprideis torosa]|uniref:Uncharacterized protein n=1 Tax=Cyprideis torosa TaxID=163714 RepID=A0A7R8ZL12_9CRUS|nr:unnamed protein product [Cyprideis torosa]CAG0890714.1 unnamed protein product [Cyprideis torosa]
MEFTKAGALSSEVTVGHGHQHGGEHGHTHEAMEHPGSYDSREPYKFRCDWRKRAFTIGVGGPVGSGKTALVLALCRMMREQYGLCVVTNDIFTREDWEFLCRNDALPVERMRAVETGGCPHAAIREDYSLNMSTVEELTKKFMPKFVIIESGGDNLAANFSRELADFIIYVIDVAGGDKIPRKGGPGITQADLLVINKTDLADAVGADLGVMERDAKVMRVIYEEFSPRQIVQYKSYSDFFVFRLTVPEDAAEAIWEFNSYEDGNCDPSNVTVVFNPGGYVVINPDGAKFPSNFRFIPPREDRLHTLRFEANNATVTLQVLHPEPGSWYLVAFKEKWFEEKASVGSDSSCDTYIYGRGVYRVEGSITYLIPQVSQCQNIRVSQNPQDKGKLEAKQDVQGKRVFFKFYVPANTWRISINVTSYKIEHEQEATVSGAFTAGSIVLAASPKALPDVRRSDTVGRCKVEAACYDVRAAEYALYGVELVSAPTTFPFLMKFDHIGLEIILVYEFQPGTILERLQEKKRLGGSVILQSKKCQEEELKEDKVIIFFPRQRSKINNDTDLSPAAPATKCYKRLSLGKKSNPLRFSTFKFTVPTDMTVALGHRRVWEKKPIDFSSTLHFRSHNSISSEPRLVTFDLQEISDVGGGLFLGLWLEENFLDDFDAGISVRVSSCLSFETRGEILSHGNVSSCSRGAYWQTNTTVPPPVSKEEATKRRPRYPELYLVVPFPHPGQWWLTIQAECFQANMEPSACNRTEPVHVTIDLGSAPCVLGGCNYHGKCGTWFTQTGFVFTSCNCTAGYRGWGCTDTSKAIPEIVLEAQFFLLTLSNLAFLPAVVLATKRHFYMEALSYFFVFAFSTVSAANSCHPSSTLD